MARAAVQPGPEESPPRCMATEREREEGARAPALPCPACLEGVGPHGAGVVRVGQHQGRGGVAASLRGARQRPVHVARKAMQLDGACVSAGQVARGACPWVQARHARARAARQRPPGCWGRPPPVCSPRLDGDGASLAARCTARRVAGRGRTLRAQRVRGPRRAARTRAKLGEAVGDAPRDGLGAVKHGIRADVQHCGEPRRQRVWACHAALEMWRRAQRRWCLVYSARAGGLARRAADAGRKHPESRVPSTATSPHISGQRCARHDSCSAAGPAVACLRLPQAGCSPSLPAAVFQEVTQPPKRVICGRPGQLAGEEQPARGGLRAGAAAAKSVPPAAVSCSWRRPACRQWHADARV